MYYIFIEFIILLYTFLVISFARYKEYMICLILFSKFSDFLPAFTCARAIGNLWSICLGVSRIFHVFCDLNILFVFSFRCNSRIIIKQFDNFFSRLVKWFNIFYCIFFIFWFFASYYYFIYIWFKFLLLFLCFFYCYFFFFLFYKNFVDL